MGENHNTFFQRYNNMKETERNGGRPVNRLWKKETTSEKKPSLTSTRTTNTQHCYLYPAGQEANLLHDDTKIKYIKIQWNIKCLSSNYLQSSYNTTLKLLLKNKQDIRKQTHLHPAIEPSVNLYALSRTCISTPLPLPAAISWTFSYKKKILSLDHSRSQNKFSYVVTHKNVSYWNKTVT